VEGRRFTCDFKLEACERSISLTWCQPNRQQPRLALILVRISLGECQPNRQQPNSVSAWPMMICEIKYRASKLRSTSLSKS
jgi:hypothetical protein